MAKKLFITNKINVFFSLLVFLACVIITSVLVHAEIHNETDGVTANVRYNATSNLFSATAGEEFGAVAATVTFNPTFLTTGWDVLSGTADRTFLDAPNKSESAQRKRLAYRAVGYGEGYLTQENILNTLKNTFWGDDGLKKILDTNENVILWIKKHMEFMETKMTTKDEYGQQLENMFALIDGIVDGYNARVGKTSEFLNRTWLFYLNMQNEIFDIARAVSPKVQEVSSDSPKNIHCSSLIKLTKHDIYFSHVTWSSFNSMLRQYKTYNIDSSVVTMSSYPGVVHSIDDWYMTDKQLAVMETTISVHNNSLFQTYLSPQTVSEFLRVMIANFLAIDAPSWVKYFSRNNSGTYNNQWMVMNMGAVKNLEKPLPPNTFWVAEQLPGTKAPVGVTSADMTDHLNKNGYWASYNIPYFEEVYKVAGYPEKQKEFGDFFSFTQTPRAKIFARDHQKVVDLQSMKKLMRYNDYKVDNYSLITNCKGTPKGKCNPPYSAALAIASRGDLNPVGNESQYGPLYKYFSHVDHGATDAKIATWTGMTRDSNCFTAHVICGPTNDQQPTFEWKKDLFNPMPPLYGIPKKYNYSFVDYTTCARPTDDNKRLNKWIGIGIGSAGLLLVALSMILFVVYSRRRARLRNEEIALLD